MKKLLFALMLFCATPCFGQLVLPSGTGVVQAPVDANGWLSYKLVLTQSVTSFSFVIIPNGTPPPSQAIRTVEFVENNVGGFSVVFASSISSPCTVSTGANVVTVCQFSFDATNNTWNGIGGSGGGSSSLGAATNVKTLGAVGNGKFFPDGITNGSNNQLTSATATFAASDVGNAVYCVKSPTTVSAALWAPGTTGTVASFVNASTITYSGTNAGAVSGMYCAITNPADSAAIVSAFNACKTTFSGNTGNGSGFQSPPCAIYLPSGVYGLSNTLNGLISSGNEPCVGIIGDATTKTAIIPTANFVSAGVTGAIINERCQGAYLKDFTLELASLPLAGAGSSGYINVGGGSAYVENVSVFDECTSGNLYGLYSATGSNQIWIHPTVINGNGCGGTNGGMFLQGVQANVYSPFLSNTNQNLTVANMTAGSNGAGTVFYGGVIDEGSVTSIQSSVDVWFNGTTLTGGANCISVDATSFIWLTGGYCGTFQAGTGGGPTVASGGVLNMTQVHVQANGASSACYTSAAYGGIVDDGTNKCTLVSGGTVYPSGGIINKTSLSHLPFNAFQTGTLAITTNLQTFVVDQPVAIQTFSWTPNNAFACTAGSFPTFSMSDGTVTVTTAATDTSTNGTVTHTFANTTASILNPSGTVGAILTVKVVTTGTCGTAPTNVNINVWGQATAPGV